MATKRLLSTQVKVFPTAYRGKTTGNKVLDPESRLNTEKNLTRIATKITSHNSFVVNRDFDLASGESEKLEVCLKGYLFELDLSYSDLSAFTSDGKVYAEVKVEAKNSSYAEDTTNTEYEGLSLSPLDNGQTVLDSGTDFIGLELSSIMESGEDKFLILEYKNSKWVVPSTSILRLDTRVIEDGFGVDSTGKSIKEELHTESIYLTGQAADTDQHWGLQIDDEGNISNIDLYQDWNTEQDGYDFIDGIEFDSRGKLINVHHTTIPDANGTTKGLLTGTDQTINGVKTFNNGIITDEITNDGHSDLKISSDSGITLSSEAGIIIEAKDAGSVFVTTVSGETFNYNGKEVATKYYMENEGISAIAKKLGNQYGNYNVGNNKTPVYFYNGEPAKTNFSMVGERTYSTNIWVEISTTNPSSTDTNPPGYFTYSPSNEILIDSAYLCGIADDTSSSSSTSGAGTLSLSIRKYPSGTFNFEDNKWLHINLNTLINNYFGNYYFTALGGVIQEENLTFRANAALNGNIPGNNFWLVPSGPDLYIGVRGNGTSLHQIYSLNIILYGSLTTRN